MWPGLPEYQTAKSKAGWAVSRSSCDVTEGFRNAANSLTLGGVVKKQPRKPTISRTVYSIRLLIKKNCHPELAMLGVEASEILFCRADIRPRKWLRCVKMRIKFGELLSSAAQVEASISPIPNKQTSAQQDPSQQVTSQGLAAEPAGCRRDSESQPTETKGSLPSQAAYLCWPNQPSLQHVLMAPRRN